MSLRNISPETIILCNMETEFRRKVRKNFVPSCNSSICYSTVKFSLWAIIALHRNAMAYPAGIYLFKVKHQNDINDVVLLFYC